MRLSSRQPKSADIEIDMDRIDTSAWNVEEFDAVVLIQGIRVTQHDTNFAAYIFGDLFTTFTFGDMHVCTTTEWAKMFNVRRLMEDQLIRSGNDGAFAGALLDIGRRGSTQLGAKRFRCDLAQLAQLAQFAQLAQSPSFAQLLCMFAQL